MKKILLSLFGLSFWLHPVMAQPVLGERAPAEINLGEHPKASKLGGWASPEFLAHDDVHRQILFVTDRSKVHREKIRQAQNWFAHDGTNDRARDLFRVGGVFADRGVIDSVYPPQSETPFYTGDMMTQKRLWRSLGWLAPDLVIVWKTGERPGLGLPESTSQKLRTACKSSGLRLSIIEETHLAAALTSGETSPANLGAIQAFELTCPAQQFDDLAYSLLGLLAAKNLPEISPAHRELLNRRKRTPLEIARHLDAVYGHHLNKVMYQPALSLVARMNLDDLSGQKTRTADVERIVSDYASGQKPTLGTRASGSVTAGHLIFAELARRADKQKYLPLVQKAADQGFASDGTPLEAMPAHFEMSDAVFMGAPILAAAGRLTGNEKYFDMCRKHVRFIQKHCLREDGIYRHSPLDESAWGRGNGFPALGLAWALSEIPDSHPLHKELRDDLHAHLSALLKHQDPTGMWRQVIDVAGSYREMTGTCMITFAILRGLRNGWLDEKEFRPAVEAAWPAIQDRISATGELIDVCTGTGKQKSLQAYLERPAILGKDERGGAMAFLVVTEYARWLD